MRTLLYNKQCFLNISADLHLALKIHSLGTEVAIQFDH